jgi:hypothetical protein
MNMSKCAFAITTPKVTKAVRDFFDCDSLQGAEIENQKSQMSCVIFDSHWKQRLFGDEYMTPSSTGGAQFISPITFAFLEELGWYRMKYSNTTPLIPGAQWGYKSGCEFVNEKCIDDHGNPKGNWEKFSGVTKNRRRSTLITTPRGQTLHTVNGDDQSGRLMQRYVISEVQCTHMVYPSIRWTL